MKNKLLEFLKSQKFLVIASQGDDIWVSNIFYGIDDDFEIYFVSDPDRKHSKQILANPNIAFSTVWFNENDHEDRKGIQGQGVCKIATNDDEIKKGVELHNKLFPEFAEHITFDLVKAGEGTVWVIEPKYIKYWDDELYGEDYTEEFKF